MFVLLCLVDFVLFFCMFGERYVLHRCIFSVVDARVLNAGCGEVPVCKMLGVRCGENSAE